MQTSYDLSARRADRVLGLSRSARHYVPRPRGDGPLIEAMQAHIAANPGHSFGLLHACALRQHGWGKTRYTALKLNLPRRGKRRLPARIRGPLVVPVGANHTWSADFNDDFNASRCGSRSTPACRPPG